MHTWKVSTVSVQVLSWEIANIINSDFNYLLDQSIRSDTNGGIYDFDRALTWLSVSPSSIQDSQQVALPSRTYGNRMTGDAWIIYWDSRLVVLTCNFKAALLYEYLTWTFIFPDAHDDPKRRLFHPVRRLKPTRPSVPRDHVRSRNFDIIVLINSRIMRIVSE